MVVWHQLVVSKYTKLLFWPKVGVRKESCLLRFWLLVTLPMSIVYWINFLCLEWVLVSVRVKSRRNCCARLGMCLPWMIPSLDIRVFGWYWGSPCHQAIALSDCLLAEREGCSLWFCVMMFLTLWVRPVLHTGPGIWIWPSYKGEVCFHYTLWITQVCEEAIWTMQCSSDFSAALLDWSGSGVLYI